MESKIKNCSCNEFVTQPNRYDIYTFVDEKLKLEKSAFTQDEIKLYCRECGKELKNATGLIFN